MVEFEFAKLLIKRKERDEARKHLEKAIAFLQPETASGCETRGRYWRRWTRSSGQKKSGR